LKVEKLAELEKLAQKGAIDLFYGDETHISSEGYVPYGWQFPDEEVSILVEKGHKMNVFGLINRQNICHWASTDENIDGFFVMKQLDNLSLNITKETFIVLDNASVHKCKLIEERLPFWQKRGLFVFYLPTYSPHLNIAETLWRHLKGGWLKPDDYLQKDSLFYSINRCMANIGNKCKINFSPFNAN
jgi:transposase